jgi:hypothetical protein
VAFEALLMGRPVRVLGDSPVGALSCEHMASMTPEEAAICLNYIFLGYLAPISALFDTAYYRWRLSSPSGHDVYTTSPRGLPPRTNGSRPCRVNRHPVARGHSSQAGVS